MSEKFQTWITPGTVVSIASTLIVIGSFVGVTNYREVEQDKDWDEFRQGIHAQIAEYRRSTDEKIGKIESRLDGMASSDLENVRLQARFDALEKELARLQSENREQSGRMQAQWDNLTTRLAKAGF